MDDPFAAGPSTSRPPPQRSRTMDVPPTTSDAPRLAPAPSGSSSSRPIPLPAAPSAVPAPLAMERSPPLTPTPTPSAAFGANGGVPLSASRLRGISPPTPAPSPQPHPRTQRSSMSSSLGGSSWRPRGATPTSPFFDPALIPPPSPLSEEDLVEHLRSQINALTPSARLHLMSQLIDDSSAADLSPLLPLITPRLKRDFLKTLPLELAFHVLSFIDDVPTLARASGVSRFWHALLNDESTWRRMCWKSGFAPPAGAVSASASASASYTDTTADDLLSPTGLGRMRTLEFGPRPAEEDDQLYTPAGRERRGTLDRNALSELAARAELYDLPPAERGGTSTGTSAAGAAMGLGLGSVDAPSTPAAAGGIAARRGQRGVAPLAVPQLSQPRPPHTGTAGLGMVAAGGGGAFDLSNMQQGLLASTGARVIYQPPVFGSLPQQPPVLGLPHPPHYTSPPMYALPGTLLPAAPLPPAPGFHPHLYHHAPAPHPHASGAPSIPSFPPPPPPITHRPQPFSYKRHFKTAYLTQDAWLHGPGRLLSTQMSADDGVVTSLGVDDEWIVVGMATSKVHVFDAANGGYVRTLDGHELGVWCLTLVSKGGGPREAVGDAQAEEDSAEEAEEGGGGKGKARAFERPLASPMGTTFSQPGLSGSSSSSTLHVPQTHYPNFFRDGATTPLAASFHSSPSSPAQPLAGSSRPAPHAPPRRRRSFPSTAASPPPAAPRPASSVDPAGEGQGSSGGMGIGAGGPTGDSTQQAGVCGTARGWGQRGAVVVTAGCDRDVRVWEVETGRCVHILRGHSSTVRCMRVLDGRPIAVSGSRDKTVRVWDIERGVLLHTLNGHDLSVRCLEVSGNKVVSGSYDATCRLWDVDTGECLHVFRGHIHQIYAVAFDGIRVVTGSLDSTVRIWSAETGEFLALLQGHTSLVGQLQLSSSSNLLVTGGSDGRVLVFSLETFEALHVIEAHGNSVTCLQFDRSYIVSGGNDGQIKLWDTKTGRFLRTLADPADAVFRVVCRDDRFLALYRRGDRTLMDLRTFRPVDDELALGAGRAGVPSQEGGRQAFAAVQAAG